MRLSPQVPPLLREGPEPLRKTWLYSMEVGVSCGVWTTPGQYHPRLVQYTGVQATRVDNGQHLPRSLETWSIGPSRRRARGRFLCYGPSDG